MSSFGSSGTSDGLLDTNVLIHSLMNDAHTAECGAFLESLESGERTVRVEAYIVHEMTYALSRQVHLSKPAIASILLGIIQWPGIECDKQLLAGAIVRWRDRQGVSFIDALLASQATISQTRVFTINVKDFQDLEIEVSSPLSSYTP